MKNLKEKVGDIFDLPQDALKDIPKLTLYGKELLLIENHHGIRIYNENELTLNSAVGFIVIRGTKLIISRFDEQHIVLEGEIMGINMGVGHDDG